MAMFQLKGEYSSHSHAGWEQLECVVTVADTYVAIDRPGQEMIEGNIEQLPHKVKFHRGWTEFNEDLKKLKTDNRFVFNAITAKYPLRPTHAHLMEQE